jgi:isopentenyl-diphosphate delta-isomerase
MSNPPINPSEDEDLLIVDAEDNVVGRGWKTDIHIKRLWHRQAFLLLLNPHGEILLQQRSLQRRFSPGLWTASVSGHVTGEDSYLESIHREAEEELGIKVSDLVYIGKVLAYAEAHNEICGGPSAIFMAQVDLDLRDVRKQEIEILDVAWFPLPSVAAAIHSGKSLTANERPVVLAEDFITIFEFSWSHLSGLENSQ